MMTKGLVGILPSRNRAMSCSTKKNYQTTGLGVSGFLVGLGPGAELEEEEVNCGKFAGFQDGPEIP